MRRLSGTQIDKPVEVRDGFGEAPQLEMFDAALLPRFRRLRLQLQHFAVIGHGFLVPVARGVQAGTKEPRLRVFRVGGDGL
jgi:hypothetical protein